MVYESDFYTTRRPYSSSRPTITSYSVTRREVPWHLVPEVPRPSQIAPCFTVYGARATLPTPRHYVVLDTPERPRRAEEQYSYSYSSESQSRRDNSSPYSAPSRSYSSSSERVSRSNNSGPGSNYNYSTERSSRSSDSGPGGYHASYSSTTSGRLPHGTGYRHYSYHKLPGVGKGQTFHHNIPNVGHKRLVTVIPSAHSVRSRPSVLIGEYDRIYHKIRPSLAYQPTDDYLNSYPMVSFNDETRSIRAKTAEILKRIHTPVPRAQRPMHLPGELDVTCLGDDWYDSFDWYPEEMGQTRLRLKLKSLKRDLEELNPRAYYSHSELPLTERVTSDNYISRLLSANSDVARDIQIKSHLEDQGRSYRTIGQGHLACVSFAGGRPISKRRNLANEDYIKDDINVLSHYGRFRAAAAHGSNIPTEPEYEPSTHRPPTKTPSGSWKSNAPRAPKEEAKSHNFTAAEQFDAAQDRKQRRRDAVEAAATREVEEEKRRKQDTGRQEELAQKAEAERLEQQERKAREAEEALKRKEEEDRLAAERQAIEEEERKIREEEERIEREAEELRLKAEAEEEAKKAKKAKKEAEKKAREEAERKAKEEEEQRLKEEAERKAKEEEEQRLKEEADRKAKEEEEQRLKEEAERKAKEEAELKAKEEAELKAKEEEETAKRAEEERLAKEEEERKAAEEAEKAETVVDAQVDDAPADETPVESSEQVAENESEPVVEEPTEVAHEEDNEVSAQPAVEEVETEEDE